MSADDYYRIFPVTKSGIEGWTVIHSFMSDEEPRAFDPKWDAFFASRDLAIDFAQNQPTEYGIRFTGGN